MDSVKSLIGLLAEGDIGTDEAAVKIAACLEGRPSNPTWDEKRESFHSLPIAEENSFIHVSAAHLGGWIDAEQYAAIYAAIVEESP